MEEEGFPPEAGVLLVEEDVVRHFLLLESLQQKNQIRIGVLFSNPEGSMERFPRDRSPESCLVDQVVPMSGDQHQMYHVLQHAV